MNPFSTLKKLIRSKPLIDTIEKDYNAMNPTNWRTTLSGIVAAGIQLAHIWIPTSNSKATATINILSALAVALGFYHAADAVNIKK